jgi:hypothetical protein
MVILGFQGALKDRVNKIFKMIAASLFAIFEILFFHISSGGKGESVDMNWRHMDLRMCRTMMKNLISRFSPKEMKVVGRKVSEVCRTKDSSYRLLPCIDYPACPALRVN